MFEGGDSQLLSVSAELGFGVGELHGQMLLLFLGKRRPGRAAVIHSRPHGAPPVLRADRAQDPAPVLGLLTGQVVPLLGQVHNHL